MSDPSQPGGVEQLEALADLLCAAAHSDGQLVGPESDAIERILNDALNTEALPPPVSERIRLFSLETFDLERVCARLQLDAAAERRSLLRLIADVTDADQIHHFAEDAFIRRVAEAIGSDPSEYADLTVDLIPIGTVVQPPPIPRDAGGGDET